MIKCGRCRQVIELGDPHTKIGGVLYCPPCGEFIGEAIDEDANREMYEDMHPGIDYSQIGNK